MRLLNPARPLRPSARRAAVHAGSRFSRRTWIIAGVVLLVADRARRRASARSQQQWQQQQRHADQRSVSAHVAPLSTLGKLEPAPPLGPAGPEGPPLETGGNLAPAGSPLARAIRRRHLLPEQRAARSSTSTRASRSSWTASRRWFRTESGSPTRSCNRASAPPSSPAARASRGSTRTRRTGSSTSSRPSSARSRSATSSTSGASRSRRRRWGPRRGRSRRIYNGQVWTGNPRDIPLGSHTQIQLEVGDPLVAPILITNWGQL